MQSVNIVRNSPIIRSARVAQLEGLFDISPEKKISHEWNVCLELPEKWNIGLIVGPSGCGKTTIVDELWPGLVGKNFEWAKDKSLVDNFPPEMSIKEITELLSSVGFSSPPSWLKPFRVLSNGEQFRATMARNMAENRGLFVVDEYTSVVDRTVAKIGSCAIAKAIRRRGGQFIAVSCHSDIVDWLLPDWIFQPHINRLDVPGRLLRRPEIKLEIVRVDSKAWELFKHHHYLSRDLNRSALCFVAFYDGRPVAFSSWLNFFGRLSYGRGRREHRTVCLPDYQGVGIGNAISEHIASAWRGVGIRAFSRTGNRAMIHHRRRSNLWTPTSDYGEKSRDVGIQGALLAKTRSVDRNGMSFEYVGPAMERKKAHRLLYA